MLTQVYRAIDDPKRAATAGKLAENWLKENTEALESSNRYVEKHGLPLAGYRQF